MFLVVFFFFRIFVSSILFHFLWNFSDCICFFLLVFYGFNSVAIQCNSPNELLLTIAFVDCNFAIVLCVRARTYLILYLQFIYRMFVIEIFHFSFVAFNVILLEVPAQYQIQYFRKNPFPMLVCICMTCQCIFDLNRYIFEQKWVWKIDRNWNYLIKVWNSLLS